MIQRRDVRHRFELAEGRFQGKFKGHDRNESTSRETRIARPSVRQSLAQRTNGGEARVMQFRLIEVKTGFTGTVFHCLVYTSLWPASRDRGFTYGNKKNEQRYVCKFLDEAIPGGYSILVAKFTFVTILFFFPFSFFFFLSSPPPPLALRRFIIQSLFDRFFSSFERNEIWFGTFARKREKKKK